MTEKKAIFQRLIIHGCNFPITGNSNFSFWTLFVVWDWAFQSKALLRKFWQFCWADTAKAVTMKVSFLCVGALFTECHQKNVKSSQTLRNALRHSL